MASTPPSWSLLMAAMRARHRHMCTYIVMAYIVMAYMYGLYCSSEGKTQTHVRIDMCVDMCIEMRTDMRTDMCRYACLYTCLHMS